MELLLRELIKALRKNTKAQLMAASATMAASVIENLPDDLPLDVELANKTTHDHNIMGSREWHIFYDLAKRAYENDTAWALPEVGVASNVGEVTNILGQLFGLAKNVSDVVEKVQNNTIPVPGETTGDSN